jgi:5-hydroxyisourate hydrolase-like protein (transthyretin family)
MTSRVGSERHLHARVTSALALFCCIAATAPPAIAGPRIEVHGGARFDARFVATRDRVNISGTLLDDADRPIARAPVTLRLTAADGAPIDARACSPGVRANVRANGQASTLTTEEDGTFCGETNRRSGAILATLSWPGTPFFTGAHAKLSVDPARRAVALALDPEPRTLPLGDATLVVGAVARLVGEEPEEKPAGLRLHLTDERGTVLGDAATDEDGRARFVVVESAMGPPGPCELRLTFDGDAEHASATHITPCQRDVGVNLSMRADERHTDGAAAALDDAALDVDVTDTTGKAVPGGSVEALFEGQVIGAAQVANGKTHVIVRWPGGELATVAFRYVPEAPWYVAGAPITRMIATHRSSPSRRAGVIAAGAAILVAFLASRSRFRRRAVALRTRDRASADVASVEVVATLEPGAAGWDGYVVDAYDGDPIAGVAIALVRAGFVGAYTLARATSGADGRFHLPAIDVRSGDRLAAGGSLHRDLISNVPRSGVLRIALVTRRRHLLARLVQWARDRGAPFDVRPEPTPAHVRRMAGDDHRTARWAVAVEAAAFGGTPFDAAAEAKVDELGHEGAGRGAPGLRHP